ncbi:MAG: DUF4976 domain-containing protein [Acidobacteria bacterium]|nr:DUF4976 domain-containing protein [Acidobacteriota bacterium]
MLRIPLLVRYPPRFRAGSRPEQFVMNIDVAPTVLSLAGAAAPAAVEGRAFWTKPYRRAVRIEYFSDSTYPRIHKMGYDAIRTGRWKYIRYRDIQGADELYDLRSDPYELRNLIGGKSTPLASLERELNLLLPR